MGFLDGTDMYPSVWLFVSTEGYEYSLGAEDDVSFPNKFFQFSINRLLTPQLIVSCFHFFCREP